jgi:hypothetical protein
MKRFLLVGICLLVGSSATVSAFDGQRQGFVLGGGLGIAPAITVSADLKMTLPGDGQLSIAGLEDTRAGLGGNVFAGYAWDNRNMLVFEINGAAFRDNDVTVSQSFNGLNWYHYFGQQGHSGFTVVGLGIYSFDTDETDPTDHGGGLLLGGGFEFAPHYQIGGYLSFGQTSYEESGVGIDLKHSTFSVVLSGVVF